MFKKYLPKSLYARVTLIVILPIFVMQSLVTYVFFARHWDHVTANLSENVAGQIAMVTRLYTEATTDEAWRKIEKLALDDLDMRVSYDPEAAVPEANLLARFNVYNATLNRRLRNAIDRKYWLNTQSWPHDVEIRVAHEDGALVFFAPRDRVFATTGRIFLFWLFGTSFLLGSLAIIFMRNQVRSILRLANAAEAFGRGRDSPGYRPGGATEVRKAGYAFIAMRERIRRHLETRTAMLAGVSHDLRTPLTRIKLALAMQPENDEIAALERDVEEMERMVEAYLEFARDEATDEEPEPLRLADLVAEITANAKRTGRTVESAVPSWAVVTARRGALRRAISNLVNNGLRYADRVWISSQKSDRYVEIIVDDNGPGIDPAHYDEVFKPFTRLDQARNLNESGVGMGLTVVRDLARAHGGDVTLGKSPRGGLRATIRLPI